METSTIPHRSSSQRILPYACLATAAIALLLTCALCTGVGVWFLNTPTCPVQLGYEMPPDARGYIAKHHLIEPEESILAYYDATWACNNTQSVILTDTRIIDYLQGTSTSIALTEIDDIQHREEPLIGTTILVIAKSGEVMSIEISPNNGGQTFYTVLREARQNAAQ